MNSYKEKYRIIIKILFRLLWFTPLLMFIVVINYIIDSVSLFSSEKPNEYKLAEYLLSHKHFTGNPNFNDRLLQVNYINGLSEKKRIIVLGSSRSMLISKENFHSNSFFNNSVSGGTIEDYIGIFGMYEKRDLIPDTVVFCLDPWLLNNNSGFTGWNFISEYYFEEATRMDVKANMIKKSLIKDVRNCLQIFSLSNFQTSINFLLKYGLDCYKTVNTDCNVFFTKRYDGSICYDSISRMKTTDETNNEVERSINSNIVFGLNDFKKTDSLKLETVVSFIKYLKNKNINIIFFLSPYHPSFYHNVFSKVEYLIVKEVESVYRELAIKYKIKIIGSYNPDNYKIEESDFYDSYHLKEKAIKKLFTIYSDMNK